MATFPGAILPIKAELLLNGAWTDISTLVYQRSDIVITRGRPDESQNIQACSMSLTLNNRDGSFSPRNTASQFYPFIGRNTQIRLSVNATSASSVTYSGYRFWGEVSSWPPRWDSTGSDVYVPIVANGVWQRYVQGATLGSSLRRFYTLKTDPTAPVAYWPAEEGGNATQFGNLIIPGDDFTWTGTPGLSSNSDFSGSDPIPLISKSTWTGTTGSYSSSGTATFTTPGTHTWTCPAGITTVNAQCWAGGGGGASSATAPGAAGGNTTMAGDTVTVTAHGGGGGQNGGGSGPGGTGSTNTTHHNGGAGAFNGASTGCGFEGGGGGGSGGTAAAGNSATSTAGATAVTGGGPGGAGGGFRQYCTPNNGSTPASGPGGGGGGAGNGGGGGGGEFAQEASLAVTPGHVYTIVVGAGGSGGAATGTGGNGYAGKVALAYSSGTVPNSVVTRFLLSVPSTGAVNGATLVRTVISSGTLAKVEIYYGTGGKLGFRGYNSVPTLLFDSGLVAFGLDGFPMVISGALTTSGSSILWEIAVITPGSTMIVNSTGSITGTLGAASQVVVNPGGTVDDTAIGHVVVQYQYEDLATSGLSAAANGHDNERAADRFTRLCTEEGITGTLAGTSTDTPLMGPQTDQQFTALMQEIEDADRGQLSESRSSFGLTYRTRVNMQNQTAAFTLNYSAAELAGTLEPTDDDQLTRNDITVSRVNGASVQVQDTTDSLSILAPPNGVGPYTYTPSVNLHADSQLANLASWLLTLGTVNEERYPVVSVDLARSESARSGLFDAVPGAGIGDYFAISNPPSFLPTGTIKQLALGFTETINAKTWTIDINSVPESPYEGVGLPTW